VAEDGHIGCDTVDWKGGLEGSQLRREQKSVNLFQYTVFRPGYERKRRGTVKFYVGFILSFSKVEEIFSL
jgi:hypothetical protein